MAPPDLDVAVVGAGAAGLATAIFTRRLNPALSVAVFDGKAKPGAKILVSGGSRCNVTNTEVTAADFNGGKPTAIGIVLKALPVPATIAFFKEIGVPLHEEPGGKLFPDSNRSRDVLDALLRELDRVGGALRGESRVVGIDRQPDASFLLTTSGGPLSARAVVLATGGLSLPKTGSDGWGYDAAARLGHSIVPTTPALVPLTLGTPAGQPSMHRALSGIAHPVRLELLESGRVTRRITGALLWTHTGISGPAALDMSRHWLRAVLQGKEASVRSVFSPDHDFTSLEHDWIDLQQHRPRLGIEGALSQFVPRAVASTLVSAGGIDGATTLSGLTRDDRRRLIHVLLAWPLDVTGSRGYNVAEVTAGGINLDEVSPRTMESRICPGLYLVGEVLDVDGRLGGFNFQWAWSSGRAAAGALAAGATSRREVP